MHEPFLVEWLMKTYPDGTWTTNVRLGRPSPERAAMALTPEEERMLTVWHASADAVVVLPDEVHIVEAMVRPEWEKISKLKMYGHLLGVTEEYRPHWYKPRRLIVVAAVTNELVEWFARQEGITWIRYTTPLAEEYRRTLPGYLRRPPSYAPVPEEEART